jgi:DNA (cytosine-5)-methyltransferase 1
MRVLDLFSGIGGFSLGLERAGMQTVAFCESDRFCRAVLARRWPHVPCYQDVRELRAERLAADGIAVDLICGGFPCQDISVAGKGAGISGKRSGLWSEYARLVGELRPRYIIVENVAALRSRGLGRILGDLVTLRYDAQWHCIQAAAVGAPHSRDRIWIVAYPIGEPERRVDHDASRAQGSAAPASAGPLDIGVADCRAAWAEQWKAEPAVGRVADGVPAWMDRLRVLGNSLVPQIPEMIGRAIARCETQRAGHA